MTDLDELSPEFRNRVLATGRRLAVISTAGTPGVATRRQVRVTQSFFDRLDTLFPPEHGRVGRAVGDRLPPPRDSGHYRPARGHVRVVNHAGR